jgi:aryl carrier-like protein
MDRQVKIAAPDQLGEIESVLGAPFGARRWWSRARARRPSACWPVWSARPGRRGPSAEIRQFLRSRLPEYMIPQGFVWLDALPLTPNGKVDREALARLEPVRTGADEERFVEPQTPIEAQIAALWGEVLGVERVGVNDNFFELGGDSILSIQLTARASKVGLSIRPRDLFQHQTVAGLARVAAPPGPAGAEQGPVTGPVPLTPIQRWFFEQPLPEPRHFAQSVLLEVPSPVEPTPERAWPTSLLTTMRCAFASGAKALVATR